MKPKVLIVDDEDFSPIVLTEFLGEQFDFDYASSGEAALVAVAAKHPQVILMDVEMPGGMNGHQACRAIKDNKASQHIPVIFVSAHTEAKDRLRAYESGGDDYISKPLNTEELKHKINLALANQKRRDELAEKAHHATNIAMMSMREVASTSMFVGFLSDVMRLTDLSEIAATTLRTLKKFQIEGAVQLRDGRRHVSHNSAGPCTPVEDAVLVEMADKERIVDLGNRSAFNYTRATIIVYDMPVHDPELYGRLKDTVVKMAEVLDAHIRSLATVANAIERGNTLLALCRRGATACEDIGARRKLRREEGLQRLQHIAEGIEKAVDAVNASDALQLSLRELVKALRSEVQAIPDDSMDLENLLQSINAGIEEFQRTVPEQDARSAPAHNPALVNAVELF